MKPGVDELTDQLATELHAVLYRLAPVAGPAVMDLALDRDYLRGQAARLAVQLLDDREDAGELGVDSDSIAAETAQDVMCGLYLDADPPVEWWSTPLGRAVARSYGLAGAESVSASVAAAMLGVTRARIYQLLNAGLLDRHPDGGVTAVSVAQRRASRQSP